MAWPLPRTFGDCRRRFGVMRRCVGCLPRCRVWKRRHKEAVCCHAAALTTLGEAARSMACRLRLVFVASAHGGGGGVRAGTHRHPGCPSTSHGAEGDRVGHRGERRGAVLWREWRAAGRAQQRCEIGGGRQHRDAFMRCHGSAHAPRRRADHAHGNGSLRILVESLAIALVSSPS